jgi:hypothetical protein
VSRKITNNWGLAVGTRIGLRGAVEFTGTAVAQTLHLPCLRGHTVDFELSPHTSPDVAAKRLLRAGWTIGKHLTCPEHTRKKRAPEPKIIIKEELMPDVLPAAVDLPPPTVTAKAPPSDRARAAQREALNWLTESFNVEKGTYAKDVSDLTIAKETGLATAVVAKLREDFYGPLKAPGEIEEFRNALKNLRDDISAQGETLRQAVRTLELRLDRLCEKNNW